MLGLFRPLEEYVGPSIVTVGAICFVVFFGLYVKIFGIRLSPIRRTVIRILEFYYLN
jgi:hypothetical protein